VKQYSTISDTIEVGCNYSGATKGSRVTLLEWSKGDFTEKMPMLAYKNAWNCWVPVAHSCNLSYSGGNRSGGSQFKANLGI
jgi:hypothetical protein